MSGLGRLVVFVLFLMMPGIVLAGEWRKSVNGWSYDNSLSILKLGNQIEIDFSFETGRDYGQFYSLRFAKMDSSGQPYTSSNDPLLLAYEDGTDPDLICYPIDGVDVPGYCTCYTPDDNFCRDITKGTKLSIAYQWYVSDWSNIERLVNDYDVLLIDAENSAAWVELEGLRPLISDR